jgi:hypothetical protein
MSGGGGNGGSGGGAKVLLDLIDSVWYMIGRIRVDSVSSSWVRAIHLDEGGGSLFNSKTRRQDRLNRVLSMQGGSAAAGAPALVGTRPKQVTAGRNGVQAQDVFLTPPRPRTAKWDHETLRHDIMKR